MCSPPPSDIWITNGDRKVQLRMAQLPKDHQSYLCDCVNVEARAVMLCFKHGVLAHAWTIWRISRLHQQWCKNLEAVRKLWNHSFWIPYATFLITCLAVRERERGLRNMIVIFKYIKCCCKRQVNNLSCTSTVDSIESNDLFNSGETLKENNCNCKDN